MAEGEKRKDGWIGRLGFCLRSLMSWKITRKTNYINALVSKRPGLRSEMVSGRRKRDERETKEGKL